MMTAISTFADFLAFNWTTIIVIFAVLLIAINRVRSILKLSKEEQKKAAIKIIKEELLKLMSDSELYWSTYESSGQIKRAEVIAEIYTKFPILATFEDQESLLKEIDEMINSTKVVMDKIINNDSNKESEG